MDAFLALAKVAKGAACTQLIADAIATPGVFVFGELLDAPNVKEVIPYSKLQSSLRIANIRELEDLVIDAMYLGMIEGKLDQKTMTLRVEKAMGRDLQPGQTQNVLAHLSSWLDTSASVLSAIDTQIQKIVVSDANYLSEKDIYDKELETAKATALKTLKSRTSFGDLDGGMDFQEVDSKPGATKRSTLKGTSSRRDRKY
ncbi:hypothetical protein HDU83_006393 [Entophlyctis luteolus]|nr:hypothetical protein HDU83_006393 [Entophlyctis luteolus]